MSLDIDLYQDVDFGGPDGPERQYLMDKNITHNLNRLWHHIGVYDILYMMDGEITGDKWKHLMAAVEYMETHPEECKKFDAPNGWGKYEDALPWLKEVTEAFRKYPKATIRISK